MTTDSRAVCGGGEAKALRNAIRPFDAAVFSDNGDVALSMGHIIVSDWLALSQAARAYDAALASTAGAGAGDWVTVPRKVLTPFEEEHDRLLEEAPKQGFHPIEMQEQVSWHALVALKEALSAVPASARSGAGEGKSIYGIPEAYGAMGRALRDLQEAHARAGARDGLAHERAVSIVARFFGASPPSPAEHGAVGIREADPALFSDAIEIISTIKQNQEDETGQEDDVLACLLERFQAAQKASAPAQSPSTSDGEG